MNRWTLWFIISTFIAFISIGVKIYGIQKFELTEEYIKKGVFDGLIISKLDDVIFDDKQIKNVSKTLDIKDFYNVNVPKTTANNITNSTSTTVTEVNTNTPNTNNN